MLSVVFNLEVVKNITTCEYLVIEDPRLLITLLGPGQRIKEHRLIRGLEMVLGEGNRGCQRRDGGGNTEPRGVLCITV